MIKHGKHRGKELHEVFASDPQWVYWTSIIEHPEDLMSDKEAKLRDLYCKPYTTVLRMLGLSIDTDIDSDVIYDINSGNLCDIILKYRLCNNIIVGETPDGEPYVRIDWHHRPLSDRIYEDDIFTYVILSTLKKLEESYKRWSLKYKLIV